MILAPERLGIGEQLEMKVYFSSASGLGAFKALVQVVWSDGEGCKKNYYQLGVSYISIFPEDRGNHKLFLSQL